MVMEAKTSRPSGFAWAVPPELGIPADPLRCRLDLHHQAAVLTLFEGETVTTKIVSMSDVAHAIASDLTFGTGLLPPNTLWWLNTRGGPVFALYVEPKIRKIALQEDPKVPPRRFTLPLPGFIFLCTPGQAPWVYAVKKKPTKEKDIVYKAPVCNVHPNGRSCAGTHRYPTRVADMPQSFFVSFFTATADLEQRSVQFPNNIVRLWEVLDNKRRFPLADLVKQGTVKDLMNMEIGE